MKHLLLPLAASAMMTTVINAPAYAEPSDDLTALLDALQIEQTMDIMRSEGLYYGSEVAKDMLPSVDAVTWQGTLDRIYDTEKMYDLIEAGFEAELSDTDLAPLIAFFSSDLGAKIVSYEIGAREAFLHPDTEAAAMIVYEDVKAADDPVIGQIDTLIVDSDLIELNVMGALNSNFMFYRGLVDGEAFVMSEDEILSDVWSQEDDIRADTENWMHAFLLMAYQPLEESELDSYIALYRTPEGRDLNRALFVAFDRMYDEISYLLGQAVAQNMQSEKL